MGGDEDAVPYIKTKADFDKILKDNCKVAIDFTASWCGPCRFIGPKFIEMAKDKCFEGIIAFYKIDVDDNSQTAEDCKISAMPTFKFYKDSVQTDELVGASEDQLKAKLDKLRVM